MYVCMYVCVRSGGGGGVFCPLSSIGFDFVVEEKVNCFFSKKHFIQNVSINLRINNKVKMIKKNFFSTFLIYLKFFFLLLLNSL